jgi:Tfp pilus assembly protein PilV
VDGLGVVKLAESVAMKRMLKRKLSRNREEGTTLIEVMIAGVILVVGFMGLFGLMLTAIASNNRNKMDSTGAMLGQAVVENINAVLVRPGANLATCDATNPTCVDYFPDCAGNNQEIDSSVGGATLSGTQIDWTQTMASTDHHHMDYVVCNVGTQTLYDVRWNIQTVTTTTYMGSTYLVTVGVKKKGQGNGGNRTFALPVTLRTYVSN